MRISVVFKSNTTIGVPVSSSISWSIRIFATLASTEDWNQLRLKYGEKAKLYRKYDYRKIFSKILKNLNRLNHYEVLELIFFLSILFMNFWKVCPSLLTRKKFILMLGYPKHLAHNVERSYLLKYLLVVAVFGRIRKLAASTDRSWNLYHVWYLDDVLRILYVL